MALDEEARGRIVSNIGETRARIDAALEESGRKGDPSDPGVLMLAVSKTVGVDEVAVAIECGVRDFGENRAQELKVKSEAHPDVNWHFIGRIQTNKIKDIVGRACLIHSVASIKVLDCIEDRAAREGIVQKVLLEVNVSGEETKDGFVPDELPAVLEHASGLSHVEVRGLMTMAPQGDPDVARGVFRRLREIRDELKVGSVISANVVLQELSMGMTQDFEQGIAEGATIVRLGHSIFA